MEASHQPDAALCNGPVLSPNDIRSLQWAIQFCSVAASRRDFSGWDGFPTSEEVKDILFAFMRGEGKWIPNDTHIAVDGIIHRRGAWARADDRFRADDRGRAAFRAKLSTMIHSMTGAKPRFVKLMNGKVEQWAVYRK